MTHREIRVDALPRVEGEGAMRVVIDGERLREVALDIDLLVDVPAGTSLLHLVGLQMDIEEALGVKVHLCPESELHPALKERVLAEARPL